MFRYRLSPETFGYTLLVYRSVEHDEGRWKTFIKTVCTLHERETENGDNELLDWTGGAFHQGTHRSHELIRYFKLK